MMTTSTQHFNTILTFLFLIKACHIPTPVLAYRVVGSENENKTFVPYEAGFVGHKQDQQGNTPHSVNNPHSAVQPDYSSLTGNRLRNCPGMIGPITSDSNFAFYCTSPERGYCDRRSGTCFCNEGYQGLSCERCNIVTHIEVGEMCQLRKECLNDCSGHGICNAELGQCQCLEGRSGEDCSQKDCRDEYCVQCDEDDECLECIAGYFVDWNYKGKCKACAQEYDPRCTACNASSCLKCDDLLLMSIRRSGSRPQDLQVLPTDELERELSNEIPFGSSSTLAFEEAEVYYLINDETITPLNAHTKECHQGINNDANFTCMPLEMSHRVCGHTGVFSFASPEYRISESDGSVRVTIQRSGGGVGTIHIGYSLQHITTSASDVSPTPFYTSSQTVTFYPGELRKSILIAIHDDRKVEPNKTFMLSLLPPKDEDSSKLSSLGNQKQTFITIVDDDHHRTCLEHTEVDWPPTRSRVEAFDETFYFLYKYSFMLHTKSCGGDSQSQGDDIFIFSTKMDSNWDNMTTRNFYSCSDNQNGTYQCSFELGQTQTDINKYTVEVFQLIPNALSARYYNDVFFNEEIAFRNDAKVNFTWNDRSSIPQGGVDFVAARWAGFITPDFSEQYTFTLIVDDYARLWIDDIIIIDEWDSELGEKIVYGSHPLVRGKYNTILIEYSEIVDKSTIKLLWSSPSTPSEIVPSSKLFYKETIQNRPFTLEH